MGRPFGSILDGSPGRREPGLVAFLLSLNLLEKLFTGLAFDAEIGKGHSCQSLLTNLHAAVGAEAVGALF